MPKTDWKKTVPNSINHALRMTKQHGIENHQMSVERLGDYLGESVELLYKWMSTGRWPVNKVFTFEHLCGAPYITQYLAHSHGYLLIKAPTGKSAEHKDLMDLQIFMNQVAAQVAKASTGEQEPQQAIDGIKLLMEDLAFHSNNINSQLQPQSEMTFEQPSDGALNHE